MSRLQSIYEYFSNYSEEKINAVINSLSEEEKALIKERYGSDLHNPKPSENWNKDLSKLFYNILIPKIRKLLAQEKVITHEERIDETNYIPRLIAMIKEQKTSNEICEELHITPEKLTADLLNLKNNGFTYYRKYYSNGNIRYNGVNSIYNLKDLKNMSQDRTIITDAEDNSLKVLLISDLHFGNDLERIDLINKAFDYCVKNGIHLIFCGGDIIDGTYTAGSQKITDVYKQAEHFIKNYPSDKSILTFSVAGDHDLSALNTYCLNLIDLCNNYRHDFIIGGYNNMTINLKNDKIQLFHHINNGSLIETCSPIILHGHSHQYKITIINNKLHIIVPSLSNINQPMPTALELELTFYKGYIRNASVKQINLENNDIILNEANFDLIRQIVTSSEIIRNTENFNQDNDRELGISRMLQRSKEHLSQIEKFNMRYSR